MSRSHWIPFVLAIGLVALVVVCGTAYNYVTRAPLPDLDGTLEMSGLVGKVIVKRDAYGVPHIYALNRLDLFFAQGFVQAQDRWFQMDFFRHVGSGRLGELVGRNQEALGTDVFMRTLGLRDLAEAEAAASAPEHLAPMQAFADGVNAYLDSRMPHQLALEYTFLRVAGNAVEIEPWTVADTLTFQKLMAYQLESRHGSVRSRTRLIEAVGEAMANDFEPPFPHGEKPSILFREDVSESSAQTSATTPHANREYARVTDDRLLDLSARYFGSGDGVGSNNWVVSGAMTEGGKPMLADDTHLSVSLPALWYAVALHTDGDEGEKPAHLAGFTMAAFPGIIAGHNGHIAWGITNVDGSTVQELYALKVNPENPLQYEWDGAWRDMTLREETIAFADGSEPLTITVRETHLGPVLNDGADGFADEPMALRWASHEPGATARALLLLAEATDWASFREAMRHWQGPASHFVFASVDGDIGYQCTGRHPMRKEGHIGTTITPGWSSEYEWEGLVPFDLLPHIHNPERGYIMTANQAVAPPAFSEYLGQQLGRPAFDLTPHASQGYRAARIGELLQERAPHNAETFAAIQGDVRHHHVQEVQAALARVSFYEPELTEVRDWINAWDGQWKTESAEAFFFAHFWRRLLAMTFDDQLEGARVASGMGQMWSLTRLFDDPENVWWDDLRTDDLVENRDDILKIAFADAHGYVTDRYGDDRAAWRWGDVHTIEYVNDPLGRSGVGFIEGIFNRGPFPADGGNSTVNVAGWSPHRSFGVRYIPTMRLIVDFADLDKTGIINSTGQSGHPHSPHYDDHVALWRDIETLPLPWSRERVDGVTQHTLTLEPAQ
jgi:penicillin amidase